MLHMSQRICSTILLLTILGTLSVSAQVFRDQKFREIAQKGMELMYQQAHDEAQKTLDELKMLYPDHPGPYFLLATNRWWQSYMSTTSMYHEYIADHLNQALELNKQFAKKEETYLEYTFFQYMCHAFKTRLHTLRREWWSAANQGRKALPYISDCIDLAQESPEFYFSAGIYHYYAESYPAEHPYIRPLMIFFPDGSAEKGLDEMEKAASEPNFTQIESMYYLVDVYIYWEKDFDKAIQLSQKLYQRFPQNTWFKAEYIRSLIFGGYYEQAKPLLEEVIQQFESIQGYDSRHIHAGESKYTAKLMIRIYHYQGLYQLWKENNYHSALEEFRKSLHQADLAQLEAFAYLPANHYFMGVSYDFLQLRDQARASFKSVLELEENEVFVKRAKACLNSPCYE